MEVTTKKYILFDSIYIKFTTSKTELYYLVIYFQVVNYKEKQGKYYYKHLDRVGGKAL